MRKNPLGTTGIMTSILGLGTVKFGRNEGVKYPSAFDLPPEKDLSALLGLARELGINTLDTAPAYGLSEERLGRLLKGQRPDWVIIGKAGEDFNNGQSSYNFTPDFFKDSLARSLKRLNTDYLDVLLIHSDGRDEALLADERLIDKMLDFKKRGLVRAIGASTKTAAGGLKALALMDVAMVMHTPDYRDEEAVLDYALAHDKGILLKKVLGSGHSANPEAAIAFATRHPAVSSAIIGTLSPANLRRNAQACDL